MYIYTIDIILYLHQKHPKHQIKIIQVINIQITERNMRLILFYVFLY